MSGTAARQAPATRARDGLSSTERALGVPMEAGDGVSGWAAERRRLGLARQVSYVAIDVILVSIGAAVVCGLRFGVGLRLAFGMDSIRELMRGAHMHTYPAFLLLYVTLIVMACMSQHLYRTSRELTSVQESLAVERPLDWRLLCWSCSYSCPAITNIEGSRYFLWNPEHRHSCWLALLQAAVRSWKGTSRTRSLASSDCWGGKFGQSFASWLENNQQLGYVVCGFLDAHPNGNPRVLGSIQDLKKVALGQFVDHLFVTLPADREMVKEICIEARQLRLNLNVVPDIYDGIGWRAPTKLIGGFPVIELYGQPIPWLGLAVKRVLDIVLASVGLVLAAPMLAVAAIWIRLDSPGPVFYSAPRVGRKGIRFRCYKLRTMIDGADAHKETLRQSNERTGPCFKIGNDPRIRVLAAGSGS